MGQINEEISNSAINQFALNYENGAINFIFLVVNWYVGRKTQKKREGLFWDEFVKHLRILIDGEKTVVVNSLSCIYKPP